MSPARSAGKGAAGLRGKRLGRRVLALAALVGGVWFAVQGGEYGTFDLVSQRYARLGLQRDIDTLTRIVDSLTEWRTAIARDPAVQERIAREEFGMVKGDREILYRFSQ